MNRTPVDSLTARRLGLVPDFDRTTLERACMARLRRTLVQARRGSSWYREHLDGVDIASLASLRDLARLPLMTPRDVAAHGARMVCVSQAEVARVVTLQTSGSTGNPKRLHFTRQDLDGTMDFFLQGMRSLIRDDDRVLSVLPFEQPDCTGDLLIRALAAAGIYCLGHWPPLDMEILAAQIQDEGITCVVGLPQHLLALAYVLPHCRIRSMLLCSDYAPPALRTRIEMACGCETFIHYGTTETGLGGGVECSAHNGCHLRESDLLVEIVDEMTGEPLPEGCAGEIVVTTLGREAMPLIRYRTGDTARMDTRPCQCGGITARLCDVRGRSQVCRLAGGQSLCSQDLDDRLFVLDGLLDYRAELCVSGNTERLGIEYLARNGHNGLEREVRLALERVPAVAAALGHGLVLETPRQVRSFSPSHTMKRTIADLRRSVA